jgi:hypothetical protein
MLELGGTKTVFDPCKFEERAAIMQFDGGLSRFEAETLAAKAQGVSRKEALRAAQSASEAASTTLAHKTGQSPLQAAKNGLSVEIETQGTTQCEQHAKYWNETTSRWGVNQAPSAQSAHTAATADQKPANDASQSHSKPTGWSGIATTAA